MFLSSVFFIRTSAGRLGLPIGAPSSPLVSNGLMRPLDVEVDSYARQNDFVYTRYADDMVFSTNAKGTSKDFVSGLGHIITQSHLRLTINESKTLFMSRNARRAVTGLIINPDGTLSIGRSRKRYLRKLLNDFQYGNLGEQKTHYLQGYLAFILDVEPAFYDRLCLKYGAELLLKSLKRRGGINP